MHDTLKPWTPASVALAANPPKPKNPFRIRLSAALEMHGLELTDCDDSIVPACCSEGCEVEPDGRCEHGCPSVLLAAGII